MKNVLLSGCAIGAVPVAAVLALLLGGVAEAGPALLALAAVAAWGFLVAALRARAMDRASAAIRRAAAGGRPEVAGLSPGGLPGLVRDVRHLLRALLNRADEAERLRKADQAVVDALAEPLVILGADRAVRRANPAAVREFGPEAASILRHPALRAAIDRALATGAPQEAELSLPVPVPRELRATVALLDPSGEDRVLVSLADRTRERAVERMRADFVANAGHELRTPLTGLIGFIETLRGPAADDPPAQQRFLAIMAEQAARMQRLVDGLLSLSRIELAEHQRPADLVDLAELAEQVAAGFEPAVRARGAALVVDVQPSLPRVEGDADQLAQVVQNLLDNALKYGGDGVRIRLTTASARPGEGWPAAPGVVLLVEDEGPGIAPEHLPRLTERFYRADAGRSRASGGTGLGLAIVKHVANRHRGQLRIGSTRGVGSTFQVWLPAAPEFGAQQGQR